MSGGIKRSQERVSGMTTLRSGREKAQTSVPEVKTSQVEKQRKPFIIASTRESLRVQMVFNRYLTNT